MKTEEAVARLFARRRFGIKPGLEAVQTLLARLGHPEREYLVVHAAGTNGKGSVCAMLASILQCAGYRTGLYTSPHLVRMNERIRVNGNDIDDARMFALIERIEQAAGEAETELGQPLTFFEVTTALAFEDFRQQGVQVAVVETGMGGRLDATNVVAPLVSVITRISLEHTQYLGTDLAAVAREKAGIIKAGRPVVYGAMAEEARDVVRQTAAARGCPCLEAEEAVTIELLDQNLDGQRVRAATPGASYGALRMPLAGSHQRENLATALACVEMLRDTVGMPLAERAVADGVAAARWPGRFQVLEKEPPVIVDGAHNPAAGAALAETLRQLGGGRALGLVAGMCSDKDARGFLRHFSSSCRRLWLVPIRDERNMPTAELRAAAGVIAEVIEETDLASAWRASRHWARENGGMVCITGSLYLAGEALGTLEGSGSR